MAYHGLGQAAISAPSIPNLHCSLTWAYCQLSCYTQSNIHGLQVSDMTCCDCAVLHTLALMGLLDGKLKFRPMTMPDRFIKHGGQNDQMAEAGLTSSHVAATALTLLGRQKDPFQVMSPNQTTNVLTR